MLIRPSAWCESGPNRLSLAATDGYFDAMQLSTITKITPEQFFAWVSGREERYELVDGEVVMMAGAGRRHDRIVVNLTTAIHSQIRGGPGPSPATLTSRQTPRPVGCRTW